MACDTDIERLTRYIHGFISGDRMEVDLIDTRELEALRRLPLSDWLAMLEKDGCRLRAARGNTVRDVLELLERVRRQTERSKQELSRRSGLSRGHLTSLFGEPNPSPTLETIIRLALGLDFRLEVLPAEDEAIDDGAAEEPDVAGAEAFRGRNVYIGSGLAGASVLGLGLVVKESTLRQGALVLGSGILTGTLIAGLIEAARSLSKKR